MSELIFDKNDVRELQRQCRHHNIFPIFLNRCLSGDPAPVYNTLKPISDSCVTQLSGLSFLEIKQIVDALPIGYRSMLEPLEEPLTKEYLPRIAGYCIATEIQKGISPVSDVLKLNPKECDVLNTCPELESRFDDDGLLHLDNDFILLDGGIKYGKYFLHYHQFLRRGFASNPNFDFLGRFAQYHNKPSNDNSFRIAIDHRRIMLFENYSRLMEYDTWYGPRFDQNKLDDRSHIGLTVVARTLPTSMDMNHLIKTEFLWKTNEAEFVKTLETEELTCPDHPYDNWHINRYIHAERDMAKKTFRHFDGAAKVYAQDKYKQRVDSVMPKNPRPAHYIKLFRIDGEINLEDWMELVSMFYKGNEMIIEYFDPELYDNEIRPSRESMHNAHIASQGNP